MFLFRLKPLVYEGSCLNGVMELLEQCGRDKGWEVNFINRFKVRATGYTVWLQPVFFFKLTPSN